MAELKTVKITSIDVVKNVRTSFDPEKLKELAASIKSNGVLEPVLLRPLRGRYEMVAGERRLRASQMAGLKEIPAVVRDLSDAKALEAQLVENLHREDMNPLDEAFGIKALYDKLGTQLAVAERLGKTDFYIAQACKITELPRRALTALGDGRLSKTVAYEIAKLPTRDLQVEAASLIVPEKKGAAPTSIKKAARIISELKRGATQAGAPLKVLTRQPTDVKDYYKNWRYWLLRFSPRDFVEWQQTCRGRYDEHTCADAVFVLMKEKEAEATRAAAAAPKMRGGG